MRKNVFNFLSLGVFLVSSLFFFYSCDLESDGLPNSKGKSSEILVITNNKKQWNSRIGDSIVAFFYQDVPGLPQPEPMFTLVNIPQEAFKEMYKPYRNIFIINIDKTLEEPLFEARKDLWAKTQQVVKISAPDDESLIKEFNETKDVIMSLFLKTEQKRIQKAFASVQSAKINSELQKKFGIMLTIPSGFNISKSKKDFLWIRKETLTYSQGLIIYWEDYTDTIQFIPAYIAAKRNEITERYIPGPADSSFMLISDQFIKPEFHEITLNDKYAVQTRGLWKVENDFMGGPFISYTLVHENGNKIITIDGYVYAPSEEKRDLVRQMNSILQSIRFKAKEKE